MHGDVFGRLTLVLKQFPDSKWRVCLKVDDKTIIDIYTSESYIKQ